jgi:TatD DNase family protein
MVLNTRTSEQGNVQPLLTKILERSEKKSLVELADAHCHLDLIEDRKVITETIEYGVRTIITNGVDTASNVKSVELADGTNIFAALGIDPEHAALAKEDELNFNIGMIRSNAGKIIAIGEIGLDYKEANNDSEKAWQKHVFSSFLDLAVELHLPVSVHSRGAMDDVIEMIQSYNPSRTHIHFFDGDAGQARMVDELGCMISVPPVDSKKRADAIKEMSLEHIMAESDSPIVGATPRDVEKAVRTVAALKGMSFESTADVLTNNTKNFFNTQKIGLRF